MKFKTFLLLLVTSFLLVLGCMKEPTPPLRVGLNVWPSFENFYLARQLGYYNDAPIQLVDYPSLSEVTRAFRNQQIEVAGLALDEILTLAATDPNIRIIVVTDFSNGADAIIAKPEVHSPADLKGRPVGVEATALGAFMLTRALEEANLTPDDVTIVPLEVPEQAAAFQQGRVDAVVTFEPVVSTLLANGGHIVFDTRQIPGEVVGALATRADLLETQRATLETLIQAWFQAGQYFQDHPEDAARRVAPREGVSPEQFLTLLEGLTIPNVAENQELLGSPDSHLLQGSQKLVEVMVKNNLLQQPIDPRPLFDDSLVQAVARSSQK